MLNSKQRATLRGIASGIEPVTQVGKAGVTDIFIQELDKAIEKRELIKITVLENSGEDVQTVGEEIAKILNAEFVCAIGKRLVFYRFSKSDKVKHIEF